MLNKYKWVACFSQTGTEICDIYHKTGYKPDAIVSNGPEDKINPEIFALKVPILRLPSRPSVDQYRAAFGLELDTVVTLHGWLRIIPGEICEEYLIYNGHPALISKYPDLKGKDKQEDIVGRPDTYPTIGSVIHRCTPVLDDGPICIAYEIENTATSVDEAYSLLRIPSLATWKYFVDKFVDSGLVPDELVYINEY